MLQVLYILIQTWKFIKEQKPQGENMLESQKQRNFKVMLGALSWKGKGMEILVQSAYFQK